MPTPTSLSLKSRLVILLSLLFLLLALALSWASLSATRDFLARQLATHAQDTATALSVRLTPHFTRPDPAAVASIVDAVFDSGYFRQIQLTTPRGDLMLERKQPVALEGVPDWFVAAFPLDLPPGQAEISTGWRPAARVGVESHPGLAYRQLWNTTLSALALSLAGWLAASFLAYFTVAAGLRPLSAMEILARRVAKGEFPRLERLPAPRELHYIGYALDDMSQALERMMGEKAQLISALEGELNHDPVTGLAKRRYLLAALDAALAEREEVPRLLVIGRITGFQEYNRYMGRAAGDELLREVAQAWSGVAPNALVAHLDGPQYACLIPLAKAADGQALLNALSLAGQNAAARVGLIFHAGAAFANGIDTSSTWLKQVDKALRAAESDMPGASQLTAENGAAPGQEEELATLLQGGRLSLDLQPVVGADDAILAYEVLARMETERGRQPIIGWLGQARSQGLLAHLDRMVLQQAADTWEDSLPLDTRISVNLDPDSLLEGEAATWLADLPFHSPELRDRLLLEIPLAATRDPRLEPALAKLREAGVGLILDRFTLAPDALDLLARLRPDWIKLDSALTRTLEHARGNRLLLTALCEFARGLKVRTCACGVENDTLHRAALAAGFDAVQGYAVGRPQPVPRGAQ